MRHPSGHTPVPGGSHHLVTHPTAVVHATHVHIVVAQSEDEDIEQQQVVVESVPDLELTLILVLRLLVVILAMHVAPDLVVLVRSRE